nr:RHS repeat-associated core domain-containing protein [Acetivibrio thermocellus]
MFSLFHSSILTYLGCFVFLNFWYHYKVLDPVTGQYYLRARYYNPSIGRFMQEDTFRGDGLNLYTYVANNPLKYVDPTGHCKESVDFSDVYDNILSKNPNDILKDIVLRKIMGPDWTPNYLRNSNEIEDYKFKAVIYLNRSDGAFLQGHSAIMLVTDITKGCSIALWVMQVKHFSL